MTRKKQVVIIVLCLLACLVVACGIALMNASGQRAFSVLLHGSGHQALLDGEKAYAAGDWVAAARNYGWYLAKHAEDPPILNKYIECCLKCTDDRPRHVRDAGRAYLQLALDSPSNSDAAHQVMTFYRKHRQWRELDYAADLLQAKFPKNTVLVFYKALATEHLRPTLDAITAYQKLVETGAAPPEALGNLALLLLRQQIPDQGWQVLEKALADHPDDPRIRVERARFQLAANDLKRADQEIEAALSGPVAPKPGPDQPGRVGVGNTDPLDEALLVAAQIRAAEKKPKEAREFAEKCLRLMPDTPEVYLVLVNALLADSQRDRAVALLRGIDPLVLADYPDLYSLKAETLIDAKLSREADEVIAAFQTAYPNDTLVFDYLAARKSLQNGSPAEAIPKLENVVAHASNPGMARYFLSLAFLENGQRDRAKAALEQYVRTTPGDERARSLWEATFAERAPEQVEAAARKLLENDATYAGSLVLAAYSLINAKSKPEETGPRLDLAKRLLERAIEKQPSFPESYKQLAVVYIQSKDLEGARKTVARAEAVGVAKPELALLKASIALVEKKVEEARKYFDEEKAQGDMPPSKAMAWAEIFTDYGQLDAALALVEAAQSKDMDEESRSKLDLSQVGLCLRSGNPDKALAIISNLASKYHEKTAMTRQLDDARMTVARTLFVSAEAQDKKKLEALLADVGRAEPNRADAKVLWARVLLAANPPDLDGAQTLCAAARKAGDSGVEVFMALHEIAVRKGDVARALDYAVQANGAAPDNLNVLVALASSQLQIDRYTDAIMTLEKLRTLHVENRTTLDLLARAYTRAGRHSEAQDTIQRLKTVAGDAAAAPLEAALEVARGEWAAAEPLLQKLHEANPDDIGTIHLLTKTLLGRKQPDQAEAFIKECMAKRPDSPDLSVELGNFYLAGAGTPDFSKASFAFTQALVQRPNYAPALRGLLEVQLRSNNEAGALGLCDHFLAKNPDDPDILYQKAFLLARYPNRRQEALTTVRRALEIAQRSEFHYLCGSLYLDLGDYTKALEELQRVVQDGKNPSANLDRLMAETYAGLKDLSVARLYCDSAKNKAAKGEPVDSARLNAVIARLDEAQKK